MIKQPKQCELRTTQSQTPDGYTNTTSYKDFNTSSIQVEIQALQTIIGLKMYDCTQKRKESLYWSGIWQHIISQIQSFHQLEK